MSFIPNIRLFKIEIEANAIDGKCRFFLSSRFFRFPEQFAGRCREQEEKLEIWFGLALLMFVRAHEI